MPHVRSRKLATGRFWYFVQSSGKETPCGAGIPGKERAHRKLAASLKNAYESLLGFESERECVWSLRDLRKADMADARQRGLRTAEASCPGRKPYRGWHWDTLAAFFGENALLDELTTDRVRAFIASRETGVSATTINRDLAVLRTALRLARELEESGYQDDPFRRLRPLKERHAAPISLSAAQLERVVRACWKRSPALGAYVELMALTSSRLSEEPTMRRGRLEYQGHKRGNPRSFRLTTRLRALMLAPRSFSRELWRLAVADAGLTGLTPHHLRHTSLTLAASDPKASLLALMGRGGWKSPEMASRYLHPGSALLEPLAGTGRERPSLKRSPKTGRIGAKSF